MADIPTPLPNEENPHHGILDQTLGELLHNNAQAQSVVMKGMNLTPEQFQQLLTKADDNDLMHTKVRDLFSSGVVQRALKMHADGGSVQSSLPPVPSEQLQITAEQAAQIQTQEGEGMVVQPLPQKPTFMQKMKGWLGL